MGLMKKISYHYADRIPRSKLLIRLLLDYPAKKPSPSLPKCRVRIPAGNGRVSVRLGYRGLDGLLAPDSKTGCWLLPEGRYRYRFQEKGFVTVNRTFVISRANVEDGVRTIWPARIRRTDGKIQPSSMTLLNKALLDRAYGTDPGIILPDTPAFTGIHADQPDFTSNEEMKIFLRRCCARSPHLYLYWLDHAKETPVVLYTSTDLTGGESLDDAVRALKRDGKLKIWYQAQLHGNEPASGEGALAVIARLAERDAEPDLAPRVRAIVDLHDVLKKIDTIIFPRLNVRGSESFSRNWGSVDLNRDYLRCQSPVIAAETKLYTAIEPDVFLDSHECMMKSSDEDGVCHSALSDLRLTPPAGPLCDEEVRRLSFGLLEAVREKAETLGLRVSGFPDHGRQGSARGYCVLRGSLFLLIETTGIGMGKLYFRRRVESQLLAVRTAFDYVYRCADVIRAATANARRAPEAPGSVFPSDREGRRLIFPLTTEMSGQKAIFYQEYTWNFETGERLRTEPWEMGFFDRVTRKREMPDAYLISLSDAGAARAEDLLRGGGVRMEAAGPGSASVARAFERALAGSREAAAREGLVPGGRCRLEIYVGNGERAHTEAVRNPEQTLARNRWLLVPAAQREWRLLGSLLEPDVAECWKTKSTFVQSGTLKIRSILRYYAPEQG